MPIRHSPKRLRTELLLFSLVPLISLFTLGAVASSGVASYYANLVYDHWLLDTSLMLAHQIRIRPKDGGVVLPEGVEQILKWEEPDRIFYRITPGGGPSIGDDEIPPPAGQPPPPQGQAHFADLQLHGVAVRIASLTVTPPGSQRRCWVQVAETLAKRETLTDEILIVAMVPQALLIALAVYLLFAGVKRALRPLEALAQVIRERNHRDLGPVERIGGPEEVATLVATINGLLARLGTALSAEQRFIADAAHQLRTPLAALKVHTERALRADSPATLQPALMRVREAADRAAHLAHQLLVLARAEPDFDAGRGFDDLDLAALARKTVSGWVPAALDRGMDLGVEGETAACPLRGDPLLLGELLSNLLDNAIRYGTPGGNITVTVAARPGPTLTVEDQGPGIPPAEHERIFERFHRLPGSPGDGCGLGLAIVREIVRSHGGEIEVATGAQGVGTRFVIRFPRLAAHGPT
jgi:two-component system sensor histidine kinase TctE